MADSTVRWPRKRTWAAGLCVALLAGTVPVTATPAEDRAVGSATAGSAPTTTTSTLPALATPTVTTAALATTTLATTTDDLLASACAGADPAHFTDVGDDAVHATAIGCLAWWRVTGGFPDDTFRPAAAVTRGQAATLMVNTVLAADVALPVAAEGFPDSAGSVHATAISRLAAADVARGFADGTYRASTTVTRGEMASFLDRLLDHLDVEAVTSDAASTNSAASADDPSPAAEPVAFDDVTDTPHADAIARIAALGIAEGDGTGLFDPAAPVTRGQMASFLARTLGIAVSAGVEVRAAHASVQDDALDAAVCTPHVHDRQRADALLAGRYLWEPHPEVELGTELTWTEDPFDDANWRFQFHALRWVWHLINTATRTGNDRYLDLAYELVRSWVETNPRVGSADPMAWNDHAAAWRARVLTCLARQDDTPDWLDQAVLDHALALADPDFYVDRGNHALNQDVGLLAAACHLQRWQLRDLAIERIGHLAHASVDEQGVTNEQSVEYQVYNHNRYRDAGAMITACGRDGPAWMERVELMPEVLAHMTLPNATYEALGDTDRRRVRPLGDPATTWLRTDGSDGAPPADRTVVYDAGFYLTRSGWGLERPIGDESFLSARFGPQPFLHGHDDHGSLTLYAAGQRLLTDPGKYRYGNLPARAHVTSVEAHNVVTIGASCEERHGDPSRITSVSTDGEVDRFRIEVSRCRGHAWTRDVAFRLADGAVAVVDRVGSEADAEIVQRWQLEVGAEVTAIDTTGAHARWPSGAELRLEQHVPTAHADGMSGGTDPLRGWVSRTYGELDAAPNLAFTAEAGGEATFVTVLRPGAGPEAAASTVRPTEGGVEVRIPLSDGDGDTTVIQLGP